MPRRPCKQIVTRPGRGVVVIDTRSVRALVVSTICASIAERWQVAHDRRPDRPHGESSSREAERRRRRCIIAQESDSHRTPTVSSAASIAPGLSRGSVSVRLSVEPQILSSIRGSLRAHGYHHARRHRPVGPAPGRRGILLQRASTINSPNLATPKSSVRAGR